MIRTSWIASHLPRNALSDLSWTKSQTCDKRGTADGSFYQQTGADKAEQCYIFMPTVPAWPRKKHVKTRKGNDEGTTTQEATSCRHVLSYPCLLNVISVWDSLVEHGNVFTLSNGQEEVKGTNCLLCTRAAVFHFSLFQRVLMWCSMLHW